jgi:hypothetical protein
MSIDDTNNNLGDVTFDGKIIHLAEQAYPNNYGTDGGVRYYAKGVDDAGSEYLVAWDTTAEWDAEQDAYRADPDNFQASLQEEDACDWSSPVDIREV